MRWMDTRSKNPATILIGILIASLAFSFAATADEMLPDVEFNQRTDRLKIVNFVGLVRIKTSADEMIHIQVSNIRNGMTPNFDNIAGKLEISGPEAIKTSSCSGFSEMGWGMFGGGGDGHDPTISINGGTGYWLSQYPILEIQAPSSLKLELDNSVINGRFGNVDSLRINSLSCTLMSLGTVKNNARVVSKGQYNILVSDIGGHAYVKLTDDGKVDIGDVAKGVEAWVEDGGRLSFGALRGKQKLVVQKSGLITVVEMFDDADILVQRDGRVIVWNGEVNSFKASLLGSGEISFEGTAKTHELNKQGSGEIYAIFF